MAFPALCKVLPFGKSNANLDGLGELAVLAGGGGFSDHVTKVGGHVEGIDVGHSVEVEVRGPGVNFVKLFFHRFVVDAAENVARAIKSY